MDAVKERDGCCVNCGSKNDLESHHIIELAVLVCLHSVENVDDARECSELWDVSNGKTLCSPCHSKVHGKQYKSSGCGRRYMPKIKKVRRSMVGDQNPRWKGGNVEKDCPQCGGSFSIKRCEINKRKFCSRKCLNESKRKNVQQVAC